MGDQLKGVVVTAVGVLFIVPDSLFVRLIDAEPLATSFWRGALAGIFVLAFVLAFQGLSGFRAVLRGGWPAAIYVILMLAAAPGFVLAVDNTSVANVVFILASTPVFASIFAYAALGEPVSRRMVLTMAAVAPGMAMIAYGSGGSEIASWRGDAIAVFVAAAFAAALTAVRKMRGISMIPAIPLAYIGAAAVTAPFTSPMDPVAEQWGLLLLHGAFIAVSTCLLTLGPRYIGSAEVSLLILLESVLAPLLVWAVIGEDPGSWALAGGAVVIGALAISNAVALRRRAARRRSAGPGSGPASIS